MLASRIEIAERGLEQARRGVATKHAALESAVRARLRSPPAYFAAFAAGFVWGLRPECRDIDPRGSARVKRAAGVAGRALLTRFVAGLVS